MQIMKYETGLPNRHSILKDAALFIAKTFLKNACTINFVCYLPGNSLYNYFILLSYCYP